jgi:hypothetical protein
LKTNKRSHLSGDSVKKQATIFGASSADRANIERQKADELSKTVPYKFWSDDDFDKALGFDLLQAEIEERGSTKPKRILNCWFEDWEIEATQKKDRVNEAKLLKKYGGLKWYDEDSEKICRSDNDKLHWNRGKKKDRGYSVIAYNEDYDEHDPDCEDNVEPWAICLASALHECLMDYYGKHPEHGVQVMEQELFSENTPEDE